MKSYSGKEVGPVLEKAKGAKSPWPPRLREGSKVSRGEKVF